MQTAGLGGSSCRLPLELERVVFEFAARQQRSDIPRFLRVAWRVKHWCVILRLIISIPSIATFSGSNRFYIVPCSSLHTIRTNSPPPVCALPRFRIELLLRFIATKPPSFFDSVRRIYLNLDILQHVELFHFIVLTACPQIEELYLMDMHLSPAYQPRLCELRSLRRFAGVPGRLFRPKPIDYGSPFFRNLTHLEFLDYHDFANRPYIGEELAQAPCLTHVAFLVTYGIPDLHACCILFRTPISHPLPIQPFVPDHRMVCVTHDHLELRWFRSAIYGEDYWAAADEFIAAKRAGKINPSLYHIPLEDDTRDINLLMTSLSPNTE
ncbi:hypothetical protein R3P38DRAFT_3120417 [Favolaschia claudopus]|uniref:F-box protein n=1 Tax=Favolaschia claudopus TaxID=2862362 RepID=A0AAV9ZCY1_9AGAR